MLIMTPVLSKPGSSLDLLYYIYSNIIYIFIYKDVSLYIQPVLLCRNDDLMSQNDVNSMRWDGPQYRPNTSVST